MYLLLNQKGDYLEDKKLSIYWETERSDDIKEGKYIGASRKVPTQKSRSENQEVSWVDK